MARECLCSKNTENIRILSSASLRGIFRLALKCRAGSRSVRALNMFKFLYLKEITYLIPLNFFMARVAQGHPKKNLKTQAKTSLLNKEIKHISFPLYTRMQTLKSQVAACGLQRAVGRWLLAACCWLCVAGRCPLTVGCSVLIACACVLVPNDRTSVACCLLLVNDHASLVACKGHVCTECVARCSLLLAVALLLMAVNVLLISAWNML